MCLSCHMVHLCHILLILSELFSGQLRCLIFTTWCDWFKKKTKALNSSSHLLTVTHVIKYFVGKHEGELSSLSGMCYLHISPCVWLKADAFRLFQITFDKCLICGRLSHHESTIIATLQVIPHLIEMDLAMISRSHLLLEPWQVYYDQLQHTQSSPFSSLSHLL